MYKVLSDNELKNEARLSKRLEKKGLHYPPVKKKIAKKMKLSSAAEADREEARKYPRLYPKGYQG